MLGVVKANMGQRAAERTYGIGEDELTPSQGWSLAKLRKTWNARKDEVAPWWQANSKEAYNCGLDALARGLQNWSKSRSGERAGAAMGFPKFRTKHRSRAAVRFTTGAIRVEPDRRQWCCRGSARSARMSRPVSWAAGSMRVQRGFCR